MGWVTKSRNKPYPLRTHSPIQEQPATGADRLCLINNGGTSWGFDPLIWFISLDLSHLSPQYYKYRQSLSLLMSFTKPNAPGGGVAAQGTQSHPLVLSRDPLSGHPAPPSNPLPQVMPCPAPRLSGSLDPSPANRGLGEAMKVSADELKQLWNSCCWLRLLKRQGVSIKWWRRIFLKDLIWASNLSHSLWKSSFIIANTGKQHFSEKLNCYWIDLSDPRPYL